MTSPQPVEGLSVEEVLSVDPKDLRLDIHCNRWSANGSVNCPEARPDPTDSRDWCAPCWTEMRSS